MGTRFKNTFAWGTIGMKMLLSIKCIVARPDPPAQSFFIKKSFLQIRADYDIILISKRRDGNGKRSDKKYT